MNADYLQIAQQAVEAIKPVLPIVGGVATSAAGSAVWEWVKARFANTDNADVLADVEQDPNDQLNWEATAVTLARILRDNPSLVEELSALLANNHSGGTQTITNALNSKIAQSQGDGATINIS